MRNVPTIEPSVDAAERAPLRVPTSPSSRDAQRTRNGWTAPSSATGAKKQADAARNEPRTRNPYADSSGSSAGRIQRAIGPVSQPDAPTRTLAAASSAPRSAGLRVRSASLPPTTLPTLRPRRIRPITFVQTNVDCPKKGFSARVAATSTTRTPAPLMKAISQ